MHFSTKHNFQASSITRSNFYAERLETGLHCYFCPADICLVSAFTEEQKQHNRSLCKNLHERDSA